MIDTRYMVTPPCFDDDETFRMNKFLVQIEVSNLFIYLLFSQFYYVQYNWYLLFAPLLIFNVILLIFGASLILSRVSVNGMRTWVKLVLGKCSSNLPKAPAVIPVPSDIKNAVLIVCELSKLSA